MKPLRPIVLIPGIFGSRLTALNPTTNKKELIWPIDKLTDAIGYRDRLMQHLWGKANKDGYFESLSGWKVEPVPSFSGIDRLVDNKLTRLIKTDQFDYFHEMIVFFESKGYVKDVTLFAYSYDWRQSAAIPQSTSRLKQFLADIVSKTTFKPIVIGHSQGGVVVKYFMHQLNDWSQYLHGFVTCATPHDGSTGYLLLCPLTGYGLSLPLIDKYTRGIWANSGMTYNLYPSSGATGLTQSVYYRILKKPIIHEQLQNEASLLKKISLLPQKQSNYVQLILKKLIDSNPTVLTQCQQYFNRAKQLKLLQFQGDQPQQSQLNLHLKKAKIEDFFHQDFDQQPNIEVNVQQCEWRQLTLWATSKNLEIDCPRYISSGYQGIKNFTLSGIEFDNNEVQNLVQQTFSDIESWRANKKLIDLIQLKGYYNLFNHKIDGDPNKTLSTPQDSLIDFLQAQTPKNSIEDFVFGPDYKMLKLHYEARRKPIHYPQDFKFGSVSGAGFPVNHNVVYMKPVENIDQLRFQQPVLFEADGDGSVALVSQTADCIPDANVVDRFVLQKLSHGQSIKDPRALNCVWQLVSEMQ